MRRSADQTARQAAKDWIAANAGPADPEDSAEVLLDYGNAGITSEEGGFTAMTTSPTHRVGNRAGRRVRRRHPVPEHARSPNY